MPANTGTVKIEIRVDDKGTIKVKKFGDQSEKAFKRTGKSVGDFDKKLSGTNTTLARMGSLVGTLVGAYGLMKLVSALGDCVKAASDLEEVTSKFNVVFAEQAKKAEVWAQALVTGYAMSTREARQYLSSVQDLLVPMGMQADAAAYLSNEIVKLSADLGSFNNLPTAQVMADIQSALVGNYETMKKYGVVINATIVQEKALAMGLAGTKNELTVAQKAFAAYTLMVKSSTAAIGDMARTQDSYANQIKTMKANIENLRAEIGKNLLPTLSSWLSTLNSILVVWNKFFYGPSVIDASLEIMETQAEKLQKRIATFEDQLRIWSYQKGIDMEAARKNLELLREELARVEESIQFWKLEKVGEIAPSMVGDIRSGEGMPDMSGPTGGTTPEAQQMALANKQAYFDQMKEQLFAFHDVALSEDQARQAQELEFEAGHFERMREQLYGYHDARLQIIQAQNQLEVDAELEMAAKKQQIAQRWQSIQQNIWNTMLALAWKKSKALFIVMKAAEIVKAIVATHSAAAQALAVPPAPNLPLQALAYKAGYLQVAAIAATSLGQMAMSGSSGGGGGSGGGGVGAAYASSVSGATKEEKVTDVTFIFKGNSAGEDAFMDFFIEKFNESVEVRGARVVATEIA